jgi:probable phosphomutase (TIGR03848 family)
MATLILVRHGRTTANATGLLAGRAPGVALDDTGLAQARAVGERLASVRLARIVTSPLERCRQTAAALRADAHPKPITDKGLTECDYGDWQGQSLKTLSKEKLWATVQAQPSAVTFPGGESMPAMLGRAAAVVRRHDAELAPGDVWVAVSHGDVIKAILADALGLHLDLFQRIQVDPASVSIVRYTSARPYVLAMNTHAGDLGWLTPPRRTRRRPAADAPVGGGSGPE